KLTSAYDRDDAFLEPQTARWTNKKSNRADERTNFFKLRAPFISNRCEKRGRGAWSYQQNVFQLDASVSFVPMLARCKYFFSFKNKKSYISAERLFPISA